VLVLAVCKPLHGTQSDIYMSVATTPLYKTWLYSLFTCILAFTCSVCILYTCVCVCVCVCACVRVWMKRPEGKVLTLEHDRSTHGCAQ